MDNIFIIPVFTTLFFCLGKFIEIKFIEKKQNVPLKEIVRDAVIIFICSLSSTYIYFNMINTINDFFNIVSEKNPIASSIENADVFTGNPEF